MPASPITAIVVAYQSGAVLGRCLGDLAAAGLPIIVVDNASRDESRTIAEAVGARVIVNASNQGFGRAMNQGVAAAETPYCLLINPDIRTPPDAPANLLAMLERAPPAFAIAPRLVEPDGRDFALSASLINPVIASDHTPPGAQQRSVLSGAALLVRRADFLALGGFDPNIFLFWEDNDLCRRAVDHGKRLLLADEVRMQHARGGSSAAAPGQIYRMRWHQAWSRFYVLAKYGLDSDARSWIGRFQRKALLARLVGDRARRERYEGSRDGAQAFLRGETALTKEGLA